MKYTLKLICITFLLLLTFLPAFTDNTHAINITRIKHLFDISHKLKQPSDVAVSGSGNIYIVDGVNNRIMIFSPEGKFKSFFGIKGALRGQFSFPLGIYIDSSDKVYVADSGNHRIQIFSSSGQYIKQVDVPYNEGIPSDPTDVVVDEQGNRMFVADNVIYTYFFSKHFNNVEPIAVINIYPHRGPEFYQLTVSASQC